MKKIVVIATVIFLIAFIFISVCIYNELGENAFLKAELEEESLYRLESRLWEEYHRIDDKESFINRLLGTEVEEGKLKVYFYLPDGDDEELITSNVHNLLSVDEDKITVFFHDNEQLNNVAQNFIDMLREQTNCEFMSLFSTRTGNIEFLVEESGYLIATELAQKLSRDNHVIIFINKGLYTLE